MAVGAALRIGGGLASAVASNNAAKQAAASQAGASQAAAAGVSHALNTQQSFQRDLTQSKGIYNKLERNRARILEGITPQKLETQSRQRLTKSRQQQMNRIKARAAARGIQTSGLTESELYRTDAQFAELDAQLKVDADKQAIDILTAGIQPGLQREGQLTQAISQASGQVVGAYGAQAQTQLGIAGQQQNRGSSLGVASGALLGLGKDGDFADLISQFGGGS